MRTADIIADLANLAFLQLILILFLNFIFKNKIIKFLLMMLFAIFALFIHCYQGMTVVNLERGIIGDLSLSGLLFLSSWSIIYFTRSSIDLFDRRFCLIIVLTGLILYLSVLDIIPFDIYAFGYLPRSILLLIFLFCMLFLRLNYIFAIIWVIALIAFFVKLQNSVNLWDYLIDPILWLLCLYKLFIREHRQDIS
ncbi:MAG: hypothetical protein K0R94_118 [Burkholderiales bacterium]|jgi:hypothetical protein|nr:hypothetical protein [Burkholderiales bacterium]